jgi:cysteine synthase A
MLETIGNTPAVPLKTIVPKNSASVWVKLESFNPTGSYKDRVALSMVQGALEDGHVEQGKRLLECTGGSTGTSLAFVCAIKNIPFTIISSDVYTDKKYEC